MAAPYLAKRRSGWYLRIRVPTDLVPLLGSHLTRSLETRDYSLARQRALLAAARLQVWWQEARRTMAGDELKDILAKVRQHELLREQADLRRMNAELSKQLRAEMDAVVRETWASPAPQPPFRGAGVPLSEEERLKAKLEGMREALSLMGAAGTQAASINGPGTPAAQLRNESAKPWPELVDAFFAARPSIGERAKVSHRQAFGEWEGLIGRKAIGTVTQGDVAQYMEWLEGRKNGRAGRNGLSRGTLIKKLQHVRSFLAWAEERAFIATNPGAKVRPRPMSREEASGEGARRAFTNDELRKLFDSPLFTGCAGEHRRSTPGRVVLLDEKYWIFLVGLLTGARVEELAEAPAKLFDLEGVLCLDLRQSGTKTKAAPRLVPVIPVLKKLGFVEWAEVKAAKGAKLFHRRRGISDWSKWCNRYLDDIGLDAADITFHSLRHCFRQMLRAARLSDELADKIFGHGESRVSNRTGPRYGRDLSPQEANVVVDNVLSPISLAHLFH